MMKATLQISLRRLRFYAYHGVLPQEREVGGDYEVNLCLLLEAAEAALEDDELEGTVNYAEVYELAACEMERPAKLLEHVAYRIARRLLERFEKIVAAEVGVCKLNPPMGAACDGAEARVKLEREPSAVGAADK